jgi:transcriptional regulator with XRE-family HTH domain
MQKVKEATNRNELVNLDKIKDLCQKQNLSFAELGRRIGLKWRDSISLRLQNRSTMTADEVFLIADELGVSSDELRIS